MSWDSACNILCLSLTPKPRPAFLAGGTERHQKRAKKGNRVPNDECGADFDPHGQLFVRFSTSLLGHIYCPFVSVDDIHQSFCSFLLYITVALTRIEIATTHYVFLGSQLVVFVYIGAHKFWRKNGLPLAYCTFMLFLNGVPLRAYTNFTGFFWGNLRTIQSLS